MFGCLLAAHYIVGFFEVLVPFAIFFLRINASKTQETWEGDQTL